MIDFWKKLFTNEQPDIDEQKLLGQQATRLWDDLAFQRAIEKVRLGLHQKWAGSPVDDLDGQQKLRYLLKLLDDVEANIRKEMNDGIVAEKVIEEKVKRESRIPNILNIRR